MARKKKTTTEPAPKADEVPVDDCPWCHTPSNRLHRRSGCKE